ncbi:energy transducer TonB [Flavobacteriaceae bacterium MHTCC 0001]
MIPKKNPELEVGRNSSLYFAIGLNIMLLLSWQVIEYKTYEEPENIVLYQDIVKVREEIDEEIPLVTRNTPPPPPPPVAMQESVEIVQDDAIVEETIFESTEVEQDEVVTEVIQVDDIHVTEVVEEVEVPFAVIQDVPLFPGCEKVKKSKQRDCFQSKINAHIREHFSYPQIALDMGMTGRVSVIFVIAADGSITKVRTRGPDKLLEDEANRIVNLLPRMTPGKQRGKPVNVTFSLPINFVMAEQ